MAETAIHRQRYWKTVEKTFIRTHRQRYWKTRVDGIRQRYWKKVQVPYRKKFRQRYWRKVKRRVKRREAWRLSAGFNGVAQGEYVSVTYQEFFKEEPTSQERDKFKERARKYIDGELREQWGKKYHRDWEVWNGPPNISDAQRVPYTKELFEGGPVGESGPGDSGFTQSREWRRAYGSRMIRSGKWFKQETLEKWAWVLEGDQSEDV